MLPYGAPFVLSRVSEIVPLIRTDWHLFFKQLLNDFSAILDALRPQVYLSCHCLFSLWFAVRRLCDKGKA